jgi:hypothetical protein
MTVGDRSGAGRGGPSGAAKISAPGQLLAQPMNDWRSECSLISRSEGHTAIRIQFDAVGR